MHYSFLLEIKYLSRGHDASFTQNMTKIMKPNHLDTSVGTLIPE